MGGIFITFEGPDGAGKTTQMRMLGDKLEAMGRNVLYTREPGGTRISEEIRGLLLDPDNSEMVDRTEALLYAAARAQHVEQVIRPAVSEGKVVLCDRFIDSTVAYQGFGRGIDISFLNELNRIAIDGVCPVLTVILDIDPEVGIKRIVEKRNFGSGLKTDRIEMENSDFHLKVRAGFHFLAREYPKRCKVVNADGEPEIVSAEIYMLVKEVLEDANT